MRTLAALLLLSSACTEQTPGGATVTGDLPSGSTHDDIDAIVECVIHLEGAPAPLRSVLINFKPRLYDEVTRTEHAGLFFEPNRVAIATEGYRDISATALAYELTRVAHWDRDRENLPSLEHAQAYQDTIEKCRRPGR